MKHSTTLISLTFDGENNVDLVFQDVVKCQKLQCLTIKFASAISDNALETLSSGQSFRELCFRKLPFFLWNARVVIRRIILSNR